MAPVKPSHVTNLPFGHLSSELLALIFEQIREVDLPTLKSVRLASRRFDAIAAPIAYRVLTLNERLVAPDAEQRYQGTFDNIGAHTNHVVIPSNLDPEGINRILLRIRRLYSIRWQYTDRDFHTSDIWLPSDFLNTRNKRPNETTLYVDNLPLSEVDNNPNNCYTRAIPPQHLTSLKLTSPSPTLSTRLGPLKRLLLQSSRLRTLHYEDRGQGTSFNFQPGERMPPLTHLLLRSYDWKHSTQDVKEHWNLSQLESLELVSVPVFNFLSSIPFNNLANLNTLHVGNYSHLSDRRQEATNGLYLLVKNHIQALEVLDITCHTKLFPLNAILKHQHSLKVLRFRDHVGFADDDGQCPTLCADNVDLLSRNLTCVHTLELDMDVGGCNPTDFLRAICAFPALHTLTLHVQTVVQPLEDQVPGGVDRDHEAAMQMLRLLVQTRQQALGMSWRRITINVGGWKRVMVRRLGGAWHRLNEMGIYAERCFVMERDDDNRLEVREEMCLENSSRRASPDP